jgi:hypothetical protein
MIDFDDYKCPVCGACLVDHLYVLGLCPDCGNRVQEEDLRKDGQI